MQAQWLRKWRASALLVAVLCAVAARAEHDTFGLGTGRDGNLNVSDTGPVNVYAQVAAALAAGDTAIPLAGTLAGQGGFAAGDLVLVLQVVSPGVALEPARPEEPGVLSAGQVGQWELARLEAVSGNTLRLTRPLLRAYAAGATQVVRVPEYEHVNVPANRAITAVPWNGRLGGVIAFLARGTLTNSGQISASGAGFRGGLYLDDPAPGAECPRLDEPAPRGAQRGEGVDALYGPQKTGRGNAANGGGGGGCLKAGGGGGGNGGPGGHGGRGWGASKSTQSVGGLGGAALEGLVLERLTLGGGGGAGHGSDGSGVPGGRGGGIVFIRARQLAGMGSITASGASGGVTLSDGGSGGGAGGTLLLRFAGRAVCGVFTANGGIGGSVNAHQVGPGGGGGGGRVLFQAEGAPCAISANGVAAGTQQDVSDPTFGAQSGGNGDITVLPGGFLSPTIEVKEPVDGARLSTPKHPLVGATAPGATVSLVLNGKELGPVQADERGHFTLPQGLELTEGPHTLLARAELWGASSEEDSVRLLVDLTAPDTSLTRTPGHHTPDRSATFDFSATEPEVSYECSLNGGEFTTCSGPVTFDNLPEGPQTLEVRARDPVGNVDDTPARYTWEVLPGDLQAFLGDGVGCTAAAGGSPLLGLLGLVLLGLRATRARRS